jgi:GntR family transcriptional regulator of arabinose operon
VESQALNLCRQFVVQKVSGVFFAPLELTPQKDVINRKIERVLDEAKIPVVLLDRDLVSYPQRSLYDLVGIDNRRAGYVITSHLLESGCRRVLFLARPGSAPTVEARIAGYRDAMGAKGVEFRPDFVCRIEPQDRTHVQEIWKRLHPDAFVCANDFTAAHLLKTLEELRVNVPRQVRLAGIDDVKYASLLSVPLTTIHQPCAEIGAIAVSTMMERLRNPQLPARDILLKFRLVVRESSSDRKRAHRRTPPRI